MALGILRFKLPEERVEWDVATHAMDWALTAWDLDQQLREKLKYGHDYKNADESLEAARAMLHEILKERGLTLDVII